MAGRATFIFWHLLGHPGGVWETVEALAPASYRLKSPTPHRRQADQGRPYARGFEHRSRRHVVPLPRRMPGAAGLARNAAPEAGTGSRPRSASTRVHAGSWMRHPDGTPLPVARTGRAADALRRAAGLYPSRTPAHHRTPLDESWGYQTTGYLRAKLALRLAGRPAFSSTPATSRPGRHPRLGARPFPQGTTGRSPVSTAPPSAEHEDHASACMPIGARTRLQLRPPRGAQFLLSSAHWWLSEFRGRPAGGCRRLHVTSTTRAKPASGCPTSTAARESQNHRFPQGTQCHGTPNSPVAR